MILHIKDDKSPLQPQKCQVCPQLHAAPKTKSTCPVDDLETQIGDVNMSAVNCEALCIESFHPRDISRPQAMPSSWKRSSHPKSIVTFKVLVLTNESVENLSFYLQCGSSVE